MSSVSDEFPLEIIFIRHGESEGNIAARYSDIGIDSLQERIAKKTSFDFRLTKTGIEQAKSTGVWIKENISRRFDRYFTSDLLRARETASLLDLDNAEWLLETDLREQHSPPRSHETIDPSLFRAFGVENFIDTLTRTCKGLSVIVVCHATIIRSFMIRLEKLQYKNLRDVKPNPDLTVRNCEIVWYSRKNPSTEVISPTLSWKTMIVSYETPSLKRKNLVWKKLVRSKFNNNDLMRSVEKGSPLLITETEDELKKRYDIDMTFIDTDIESLNLYLKTTTMLPLQHNTDDIESFL